MPTIKLLLTTLLVLAFTMHPATTHSAEPPAAPMLRIEAGMHTAIKTRISVDAAARYMVSASNDKTVRVWDVSEVRRVKDEGDNIQPIKIIRPPIGDGNEGKLHSVAISPDGELIATGGWTQIGSETGTTLYLFSRKYGSLIGKVTGLPEVVLHLSFSADGNFLVASLGAGKGVRLFSIPTRIQAGNDNIQTLPIIAEDSDYGSASYGADFSSDGKMLVTSSWDGYIRLYDLEAVKSGSKTLRITPVEKRKAEGGSQPFSVKYSPDKTKIAVGFSDTANVNVVSGRNLQLLYSADNSGINENLGSVTWSTDGSYLYAGGSYAIEEINRPIRRWSSAGRGSYIDIKTGSTSIIMDLVSLPDGSVAFAAGDPAIGIIPAGAALNSKTAVIKPVLADYRGNLDGLQVSEDGAVIKFAYHPLGKQPASFSITDRTLDLTQSLRSEAQNLFPPDSSSLNISNWKSETNPVVNGKPLGLRQYEMSRSVSISLDKRSFLLGTEWFLRRFDSDGNEVWNIAVPATAWAVNISKNGKVAVAAFGDGTIRWYRYSDGKELAALFPHADKKRWVLWTPEGFFDHSPGGEELVGFHLNRGKDNAAEFIPVNKLYNQFYRPDIVSASFEGKDFSDYAKEININKLLKADTLPPTVRLLTQSGKAKGHDSSIKAELCDNGGGIGDITLYLNGMPVTVSKGRRGLKVVKKDSAVCFIFEHTVTLTDGGNEISLMAYNNNMTIESNRDSINLSYVSGNKAKPALYILTVAVNSYRDGDLKLSHSVSDAKAIAKSFKGKGLKLFSRIVVHELLDAQVTRTGMERAFAEIGKKTSREDVFLLFVAGHGITGAKDGAYYFIPYDFRYTGEDAVVKQGVSMDDFKEYLAKVNTLKSLILLDTCNSGSFAEALASRGMVEKTAINKLSRAIGRATIVASSKSQVALEGYQGHGAFTWTILDGLKGKAADGSGKITINGLATHVEELLPQITYKKWGFEQVPQKNLQGMDFPIGFR